jgi:hypothetical protein
MGLAALVLAIWLLSELFGHDDTVVVEETTVTFRPRAAYHLLAVHLA